eukprot:15441373-Alexandrium_andersonii.AAC.1
MDACSLAVRCTLLSATTSYVKIRSARSACWPLALRSPLRGEPPGASSIAQRPTLNCADGR